MAKEKQTIQAQGKSIITQIESFIKRVDKLERAEIHARDLTKRLDKIEKQVESGKFLRDLLECIVDIVQCDNCSKVVMAKIVRGTLKIKWARENFYQGGTVKSRIGSWCSKKCEEQWLKRNET